MNFFKTKILFLTASICFFVACGDDSSSSTEVVEKITEEDLCADKYGYEIENTKWYSNYDETSFLKEDIENKARSVMFAYSPNMEVRSIEYDEDEDCYKILVMDMGNSPSAHNHYVYADIEGCSYRFSENGEMSSFLKEQPGVELSSCVCKEKKEKFLYLNIRKASDEPKSSSSEKVKSSSSSKIKSSSSSAKSSSSEKESSSSVVESSSSEEKIAVLPVVAKSYPLECSDNNIKVDDLIGYTVAYEFNDLSDMGKDFFGKNPAYVEDGMPSVDGDCNSLILDGTNGLRVPISDDFKNKGFIAEIKFMPETTVVMGNIFAAEPPGSGKDGWMVRLDGQTLDFHIRDADIGGWTVETLGEISLKEWHVFKVEIYPSLSEVSGNLFYKLNLSLDGSLLVASEFEGDVSQLIFDLGIGYDAVHQEYHTQRFFKGKIDYIRYGALL